MPFLGRGTFGKLCISAGFIDGNFQLYAGICRLEYIFRCKEKVLVRWLSLNDKLLNFATPTIACQVIHGAHYLASLIYYLNSGSYFHYSLPREASQIS